MYGTLDSLSDGVAAAATLFPAAAVAGPALAAAGLGAPVGVALVPPETSPWPVAVTRGGIFILDWSAGAARRSPGVDVALASDVNGRGGNALADATVAGGTCNYTL